MPDNRPRLLTRRTVLRQTSLLAAGLAGVSWPGCTQLQNKHPTPRAPLRIGLVSDVHYADKKSAGSRHYRDSLFKLSSAIARFNESKTEFIVELGDFIDAAESAGEEIGFLRRIEAVYRQARCPRHHVLGNHCVYTLTKEQFLNECGAIRSYYSFDVGEFHFVLLDACFRRDGRPYGKKNFQWTDANIPPAELAWLQADLKSARGPVVAFVHQRLDIDDQHGIANQGEVRRHLEESGQVLAVFQGHHHTNDLRQINGIHYCTLAAMVDTDANAYALVTLHKNGAVQVDGFGRQQSWRF